MPIFVKCLITAILLLPVGLLLRAYAEKVLGRGFTWTREGSTAMKMAWDENKFLGFLLGLEGLISNLALLGFVVGVPLYFWKGI